MARKADGKSVPVDSLRHKDKRKNIPTEELRGFLASEEQAPASASFPGLLYARDPSLDPQLVWKGKDEQDRSPLAVPSVPLYIQEKIHPQAIIEDVRAQAAAKPAEQPNLFSDFNGIAFEDLIEFYRHDANWANRMILGDSLLVMTSLAEKEGLKGRIQMIYMDPPYGIRFGSNWQVSTRKRDVKDGKIDDATRQPEQIRAFRDTWELGIHSYLAYWRDRLVVARELLTETGSIFVQIGDENVHLVRCVMDEVFGAENFASQICFKKTSGAGSFSGTTNVISSVADYILWYAKDLGKVKYRQLFRDKAADGPGGEAYVWAQDREGRRSRGTDPAPPGEAHLVFRASTLTSQTTRIGQTTVFPVQVAGRTYVPGKGGWKTNAQGMGRLHKADRLIALGNTLSYVRFINDFPSFPYTSMWEDTTTAGFADSKVYVVQTNVKVLERCLVMATDPGDLVLDPTCGGGTTAYVAEEWGRRWITIDTSRVALALARTRLMSARYPYYLLSDTENGQRKEAEITGQVPRIESLSGDVRKGFVYKRVPHVTLKSIANNEEIDAIHSRWQAKLDPAREALNKGVQQKWEEWEVPRDAEPGWSAAHKALLAEWWKLRTARQAEIDASIARRADIELLYDQPYEDPKRIRVTGPFTVESLSPHRTVSREYPEPAAAARPPADIVAEASRDFGAVMIENLRKAGVQNTVKNERLTFTRLDPHPGEWVHARGEYLDKEGKTRRAAICIGPEHGTVGPELIRDAAKEAVQGIGYDILVVAGFAFDPHVSEEAKRYGSLVVLPTRINADLQFGDEFLKKTGAGNLFMVFGEPDLALRKAADGTYTVEIKGLDIYDPTTGKIRSSSTDDIACWFLDTDYNGESFFVRHAYFTGAGDPYEKLRRALRADVDEAAWSSLYSTRSRPFPPPRSGRIAVKVINHFGDEVLRVYPCG